MSIGMAYHRGSSLVVQREYSYDALGRPTTRNTARQGAVVNDIFAHNTRSELSSARVNGVSYGYAYDNIGNREFAVEGEKTAVYSANALNQYTRIVEDDESLFLPEFDADGNQTRVQTSTGSWAISYNNENRPTDFTAQDAEGNFTTVHCSYDYMGRRSYKKVISGGEVVLHQRYIYRGYLQIACIDLTRSHHPVMWLLLWDPTQPVATRPLAIQKDGTWRTYGLDLTKNVCEVFGSNGYINTAYTYTPFGEVTASGSVTQPIQWSSEFYDPELGMVYYNYRHYNTRDGRWIGRDILNSTLNEYSYLNARVFVIDYLGNEIYKSDDTPIIEHITREEDAPKIPIRKGNLARSYTYIFGEKAFTDLGDRRNSLISDRKVKVNSISDILIDINDNLQPHECISRLLIIAHGYSDHIMGTEHKPAFKNLKHVRKSGAKLSNAMCKNGKIVIFACDAALCQNMLLAFARSVGVRVLANQGTVAIENRLVLYDYITKNYSLATGDYFSLRYKEYNAILYSNEKPWKIFSPKGKTTTFNPIGTDTDPVLKKDNKVYMSIDKLFSF